MREVMRRALEDLEGSDTHLHLSFDVDYLDPDIAPGTGTPVRGGPSYREAQLCMEMLADTGRLGSMDLVELDRKSTRLNSSHSQISYAVFCLKKKTHRRWEKVVPSLLHRLPWAQ